MALFKHKLNRIVTVSVIASISLLSVLTYLFVSGKQLTSRYSPQINAAMEIKLNASLAHLWMEEYLSGDKSARIDIVNDHLNTATSFADALLGRNAELIRTSELKAIEALSHPEAIIAMKRIRNDLDKFIIVAERRFYNTGTSSPGSEIDQQFDWIFEDFLNSANLAETMLKQYLEDDLSRYRRVGEFLMFASCFIAVFLTWYLYRMDKLRERHVAEIESANQEIESKNKGLDYLAHFDTLTGLPNRVLFVDRLEQAIEHSERSHESLVLLFIDLDRFKNANDRLGHHNGDILLKMVAERLKTTVRSEDTVSRLGGDEFTITLAGFTSEQQALAVSSIVAKSIIEIVGQVYNIDSREAHVTASIGGAIYPGDGTTSEQLLLNADMAMYHAKASGRNNFQYHSEELKQRSQARLQLEVDLRRALKNNEFFLEYQNQWNLSTGKLAGMEVLLRWNHPHKGIIDPDDFIPCCEESGLMGKIEDWVFDTALKQYASWKKDGLEPERLALNISLIHFQNRDLIESIVRSLTQYSLKPDILELELTESVLMENTDLTTEKLNQLKNLGIHLAIDDFGTGYSSMSYLLNFPIDILKIDRSFITKMHSDTSAGPIITNIIFLANSLDMEVVAEGVETKEQAEFLNKHGCQYAQGYLLGKPVDKDEMTAMLLQNAGSNITVLDSKKGFIARN